MLNIFIMSLLFLFGSCEKSPDIPQNNNNPNNDPAQYGTHFAGVPEAPDATIYQVNMRTFSDAGNFQGVTARLDDIKNLGVNVIYLMPIHPIGIVKTVNSPYCIRDYKAINSEFGNLDDLRQLVDGAHERGMAVLLDWVANHTAWDHVWMTNTSWYKKDANGEIISPNGWNDVAQLNFDNFEMRKTMIKAMKYWVLAANIDGYRCDYADGPPADFWKQAIDTLQAISTHKYLMLAEGTRSDHFAQGFDYTFGFRFFEQLKRVYENNQGASSLESFNASEYSGAGPENYVVRYTTNHDVNSSDGTPLELFGGRDGSMAAFVVSAYMKSVPMIYNGQEVGLPYRLTFPFTNTNIDWTLNPDMVAEYKKIIGFRNSSFALRRGVVATFSNANVCAFTKTAGNQTVLVLCNLKNTSTSFSLPAALANTSWNDAFTDASTALGTQITIAPYEYLVLKK